MTNEELIQLLRSGEWGGADDEKMILAAGWIEALLADRRFILDERDRTFALMLARVETAEADRDRIAAEWAEVSQKNYQRAKAAEARVEELESLLKTSHDLSLAFDEESMQHHVRADRLEALLREARIELEHYVTGEYPKDEHPHYERQWNRDMDLCRRIEDEFCRIDAEFEFSQRRIVAGMWQRSNEEAQADTPIVRAYQKVIAKLKGNKDGTTN